MITGSRLAARLALCVCFVHSAIAQAGSIEVYADKVSAKPGEVIGFHISSNLASVGLKARYISTSVKFTTLASDIAVTIQPMPAVEPWKYGADWPTTYQFTVPEGWLPGLYEFRVFDSANPDGNYKRLTVVIRAEQPGSLSRVVVLANDSTLTAYNLWGGKSNYKSVLADDPVRASVVAYNRPGTLTYDYGDYKFPEWADSIGMPIEYISSLDLHFDDDVLEPYDILVLAGHSEYWSREMRHALEEFLDRGGKLISLSGNTMWWAVRFRETTNGVQMISCKGWFDGPDCPNVYELYTGYWHFMGQSEDLVLGASWEFGGYVNSHGFYTQAMGYGGYFAETAMHWFWAGTGVLAGDQVGQAAGIAGYEVDSPPLVQVRSHLRVDTTHTELPAAIELLGATPAAKSATEEGYGAIIYFPYGVNGGEVFNCGSVDCAEGLKTDPQWRKAILNVFVRFGALTDTLTDYDWDGINDADDNCIALPNPDQIDLAGDGSGDVCDRHCH